MSFTDVYQESALPWLTADQPGTGGVIKRFDRDFVVEEIPRYPASGQGTHTYFLIEKQGLTTLAAIAMIAQALHRQPRDIGYAGLKDAHGITRQMLSIEHVPPEQIEQLGLSRIRVLSVTRHTNKIKLGHLAGNRFVIRIRDTAPSPATRAGAILEQLRRRGVPNYFGPQRFGARGDNAAIGRAVLAGDFELAVSLILGRPGPRDHGDAWKARTRFDTGDLEGAAALWRRSFREQARLCAALIRAGGNARKAWRAVNHTLRKLYVSAFQSALFNQVLAERIQGIDRLETGDIAWKHANGACFTVEDAAVEQPRCDALEISPTGPLFGRRMTEAAGMPGEREAAVLAGCGLPAESIRSLDGGRLDGARRPLRVPLHENIIEEDADDDGPYLELRFTLPAGAYATTLLREVCKATDPLET